MFEESLFQGSLVESTGLLRSRNRWPAMLSLAVQAAIAAIIVAVPMLHPELLPMHAPTLSLTPPPPPRAPQPPQPPQHVHAALVSAETPSAPSAPPAQRAFLRTLLPTTPVSEDPPIPAGTGPSMASYATSPLGIGDSRGHTPNVTAVSTRPAAPAAAIHVSSGVIAGLLLYPIQPAYPPLAKASRQEGTVIIRAVISQTGHIEQAQVVSGPIMLQSAALEAVERARYKPYLLNGQPTEVDTTISINFRLGS